MLSQTTVELKKQKRRELQANPELLWKTISPGLDSELKKSLDEFIQEDIERIRKERTKEPEVKS